MKDPITIKDIARELNISPSTVSRALKNNPQISKATIEQVQALAERLDYRPNTIAQSLRQSRTFTIGVIVPEIAHHFFADAISGIEDIAYKAGYNVIVCQSNESYEREVVNTKTLLSSKVDGILVSVSKQTSQTEHFNVLKRREVPLVFFDRVCEEIEASKVIFDDYEAAFATVEHLIEMGYKRIAHIGGPAPLLLSQLRHSGYVAALKKHGLPVVEEWTIQQGFNIEDGKEAALQLLADPANRPDAIFGVNDLVAIGAMLEIKKAGLHIPNEIGVAGFCDEPIAEVIEPALTSFVQPSFEIGRTAARLLINQIESPDNFEPKTELISDHLKVRASTLRNR
ncbi:LacI family transcriptional regulator [Flexibacter flexilis DSM 6793]|uniref:LacI family transcriptional regulator n=1 Tax=Flexibacter flexilis DSM 6793 TaxID=927664 RepID=A0A1I1J5V5_9BACT|nr:LacI family DNA-binding transcriptional regulator [Flexibacter flexilis]SFC41988.1 LacI family transcriptional regulator [Flexibacter flexilis DSM 6793]